MQFCNIKPAKKNILAIISYPFLPATTGGEISTLNILRFLSFKHDVTVFTVEPYNQNFKLQTSNFKLIFGMKFKVSRYFNIFLVPRLLKLIAEKNTELLFFDQPWFGWLMLMLKIFSKKKIFIRSNNIEYLRFKSMGVWFWQMLYVYEKWTYRISDLVIFVSEVDRQKAIYEFDLEENKTLLTPYGIEISEPPQLQTSNFKPAFRGEGFDSAGRLQTEHGISAQEKILLFFATMNYAPNYEAVEFIAEKIYPLLKQIENFHFKILICGKNLPADILKKLFDKPEIKYCGFVENIEDYIDAADVMINPILSGGGVKTKAIDTLARNKTVISTKTGAEGIDPTVCGNKLIIVEDNDWGGFVNAILENIDRKENIPAAFYETYSWTNIIEKLSVRLETLK
ncbi:MAG: glycosyltransferase family 4 protein [Bacteroidia bacterium]